MTENGKQVRLKRKKILNYSGRNFKKERTPDVLNKEKRTSLMKRIRSQGTRFEKSFIDALKTRTSRRFILNPPEIVGKPDIVFFENRVCVFLDSDFWHGWQYPRWKHLLKDDFWRKKIETNRRRDKRVTSYLRRNNWKVIRIWEHNLKYEAQKCFKQVTDHL